MSKIDVDEIRRQMALIRRDMHADVTHVVDEVEEALDWRAPIRNHPYIAMGVGLLAGYFLVPRKKKSKAQRLQETLAELPPQALAGAAPRLAGLSRPEPVRVVKADPPKPLGRRLLSWGVGMAWPLVSQAAQSYAAMWLEDQLKQQMNPDRRPPAEPPRHPSAAWSGGIHDAAPARTARRG